MMSEEKPRVLAIDPGKKRVGLAVSDPFGNFSVALDTLSNYEGKDLVPELSAVCKQYGVQNIVMGLPVNLKGEESIAAQAVRALGGTLESALELPIEYMDERMTSKIAEQSLREMGIQSSRHRKTGIIDQAAAMRLLQDYLDRRNKQ
jgi:putative Holliday junction resolvase